MSKVARIFLAGVSVYALSGTAALHARSADNVLLNGSFEDNTTGSDAPDGWTRQSWTAGPVLTRDPDARACGACAPTPLTRTTAPGRRPSPG